MLGEDYQHRYFWIEACRLFTGNRNVARVGIEVPLLRGFDDVVTTYGRPVVDAHGRANVVADHHQLKFHLKRRTRIVGLDLIDPGFINASTVSLLERAHEAVAGPNGDGRRLNLVTTWDIDEEDALADLVIDRDGALDLDVLFTGGPRSRMGKLREAWRLRLGRVDDVVLREVASRLRFWPNQSIRALDLMLDNGLDTAGLAPVDYSNRDHRYVGVSRRFITDGTLEHDKAGLDAVMGTEGLRVRVARAWDDGARQLGIKSFEQFAMALEDDADTLNLVPTFHGRYLLADVDWDRDLVPAVGAFLDDRIKRGGRFDLHLDAHLSIGYLSGYLLGKVDADVAPVERRGRTTWRPTGARPNGDLLTWREIRVGDGPESLAIEVTRAVADDVTLFVQAKAPAVGQILALTIEGGPNPTSVRNADHAAALASDVTLLLDRHRTIDERVRPLHVFVAAPVPLAFFLGQEGRAYGPTVTYEYDFTTRKPGAYSPAFHLPPD